MARVCVPAGALPRWTDRWTRVGSQEAAKGCGHLSLLWLHPSQPLLGRLQGRAGFFWGGLCGGFVAVPTAALETEPQLVCGGRSGASGAFSSFSLLSLCLSLVPRCALTGGEQEFLPPGGADPAAGLLPASASPGTAGVGGREPGRNRGNRTEQRLFVAARRARPVN